VYSNPRGSGATARFLRANINDWKGPSSDVLTAVDKTIDEGWADKDNLLITIEAAHEKHKRHRQ
jgi:dipeptidyl aminopeptidase/acylaminoacyl peptidase